MLGVFVVQFVLVVSKLVSSRTVHVGVQAPWELYPASYLVAMSEYMSENSNDAFWEFTDGLCTHSDEIGSLLGLENGVESLSSLRELALSTAKGLVSKKSFALLGTSVDMGMYMPAVSFSNSVSKSYGNPCNGNSFLLFSDASNEVIACSTGQLKQGIAELKTASQPSNIFKSDHIFPSHFSADNEPKGQAREPLVVTLYGILGSPSFCSLHSELREMILSGVSEGSALPPISYAMAHSSLDQTPLPTTANALSGFGVYLDIKNMEYKAVDDSHSAEDGDNSAADSEALFPAKEEIMGVNFATLHELKPELGDKLKLLRDELKKDELSNGESHGSGATVKMKVWRMKDLGLQATSHIIKAQKGTKSSTKIASPSNHSASIALTVMADIVENFPAKAAVLTSSKVSSRLREEVAAWWEFYMATGRSLPLNAIYLNGAKFDLDGATFNIFDMMSQVRSEYAVMDILTSSMGLSTTMVSELKSISANMEGSDASGSSQFGDIIRIDMSKGGKYVVNFINNLEKDVSYKKWPKSLKQLSKPSWSLHTIARNLYTIVMIYSPTSLEGNFNLYQLLSMVEQSYPIRVGFVLSCEQQGKTNDLTSSAVSAQTSGNADYITDAHVCELYAKAKQDRGNSHANGFIKAYSLEVVQREMMKQQSEDDDELDSAEPSDHVVMSTAELAHIYAGAIASSTGSWTQSSFEDEAKQAMVGMSHTEFALNSTLYIEARNIPVNQLTVNGIVLPPSAGQDISQQLMQTLAREQYIIGQYVASGDIEQKSKSIFSDILAVEKAYTRYHVMLEPSTEVIYADFMDAAARSSVRNMPFSPLTQVNATDCANVNTLIVSVPPSKQGYQSLLGAINWMVGLDNPDLQRISLLVYPPSTLWESSQSGVLESDVEKNWMLFATVQDLLWKAAAESHLSSVQCMLIFQKVMEFIHQRQATTSNDCSVMEVKTRALLDVIKELLVEHPSVFTTMESSIIMFLGHEDCDQNKVVVSADSLVMNMKDHMSKLRDVLAASHASQIAAGIPSSQPPLSMSSVDGLFMFNARVVAIPSTTPLHQFDLQLLAKLENKRITSALQSLISEQGGCDNPNQAFLLTELSSFCGRYGSVGPTGSKRYDVNSMLTQHGLTSAETSIVIDLPAVEEVLADNTAPMEIVCILNPLSHAGQRAASVLKLFQERLNIPITLVLTPLVEITEFPLKSFYRYVTPDLGGGDPWSHIPMRATFEGLPTEHTLTVRPDVPEAWNVQATAAVQDIDNLQCDAVSCGDPYSHLVKEQELEDSNEPIVDYDYDLTKIMFTLKTLLVAGQCFEEVMSHMKPPSGLQLLLQPEDMREAIPVEASSTDTQTAISSAQAVYTSDTLVMNNLGYFQLQANQPGLFKIVLAPGRASSLYVISLPGEQKVDSNGDILLPVAVRSFADYVIRLNVEKRKGMEHMSLLDMSDALNSDRNLEGETVDTVKKVWNKLSNIWKESDTAKGSDSVSLNSDGEGVSSDVVSTRRVWRDDEERIHVFSLATGHMYERLLRIMMLSVVKRSSMPVKFWLFENYLSPTFKENAEWMSKEYGFEIGYVTYKWPMWLTQQTEKQRIIWGYKILFLDVLFPLDVKRVIYVDSDQVVRSDLKELWEADLDGKPYGYVPFCTSRESTLGFQFWRSGFWKDHLQDKPYHISALYVVDLARFRKHSVGDILRSTYDGLARDPNSLANLDQDLPNFAQHQVPIHSLPQEWLWCETWCSDDSKKTAKTIDLCNNPLHKEPKLDMARRVISGDLFEESWVELDSEIKRLLDEHNRLVGM